MSVLTSPRTPGRPARRGAALPSPRQPNDPLLDSPGGVPLTRLVALARLTPAQALEIGAGLLGEAVRRRAADPDSADEPAGIEPVVIGADGRVVLGQAARGGHDGEASALAAVLADVAAAAGFRGRPAEPAAGTPSAALARAVQDLPVAGVAAVAAELEEAAAVIDRAAVRAELGALVRAVGDMAGPGAGGGGVAPSTAARRPAAPSAAVAPGWTALRRAGAWLLSLVVLASIVALEVALLRDEIATDIGVLLDAGRGGSAPTAPPEAADPTVEPPAPAAAGRVTGVDLRPLGPCAPGARCTVRVLVRLAPGSEKQVVTWSYRLVDPCSGTTDTARGGSVAVPAKGQEAAAVDTVRLPEGKAVVLVAVTDRPAAAASAPLSVGSCRPGAQAG